MPNPHGSFIWYELLTTDPDAAAGFYGKVGGWSTRSADQAGMDYRLFSIGGADVAGLMKLPAGAAGSGMRPGWLGYVGVDDVDAAAAKVTQAGGSVHMPPTDIPDVGRLSLVADPQGVVFYVMRGASEASSEAFKLTAPGHCAWNELVTTDQAAALAFYTSQFGWEKGDAMPIGETGDYRFIHHGGGMIGAVMNRMEGGGPPMWNFYFRVPSIAAAADAIRAHGGTIHYGPAEVPGGDFVVNASDPQGAAFGLIGAQT